MTFPHFEQKRSSPSNCVPHLLQNDIRLQSPCIVDSNLLRNCQPDGAHGTGQALALIVPSPSVCSTWANVLCNCAFCMSLTWCRPCWIIVNTTYHPTTATAPSPTH